MGENLPVGKKPFFISLPVSRDLDGDKFREAIKAAYMGDYKKLLRIHFDEERSVRILLGANVLKDALVRFLGQIGFFRAKSYMEQLLTKKYYESVAPTLRTLDNVCKETERVSTNPTRKSTLFNDVVTI